MGSPTSLWKPSRVTNEHPDPTAFLVVSSQVVRLGAWCDSVTEDERRISFRVGEFAVLADGRRLTLHTDRGFDLRAGSFGRTPDPWAHLTLDQLRTD